MEFQSENEEIREGDIVFECPHCGKSLVVEAAGAGLEVPCTDCGQTVIVPLPGAEEVLTPDEAEEAIARLDEALTSSTDQLEALRRENEVLGERRAYLEHMVAQQEERFSKVAEMLGDLQARLDELTNLVADARTGRPG